MHVSFYPFVDQKFMEFCENSSISAEYLQKIWTFNFPRQCSNMPKVRWLMLYDFVANFIRFPTAQTFWKRLRTEKVTESYSPGAHTGFTLVVSTTKQGNKTLHTLARQRQTEKPALAKTNRRGLVCLSLSPAIKRRRLILTTQKPDGALQKGKHISVSQMKAVTISIWDSNWFNYHHLQTAGQCHRRSLPEIWQTCEISSVTPVDVCNAWHTQQADTQQPIKSVTIKLQPIMTAVFS